MEETKKCPYCGEEIDKTASKCRYCGEWVEGKSDNNEIQNNVSQKESEEPIGFGSRMIVTIILAVTGWALFYFGSWHLILGKKINLFLQYLSTGKLKQQNVILDGDGFLFRINSKYFGVVKDGHFFDSPMIQWMMLILSIGLFIWAIEMLLTGDFGNDD